MQATMDFLNIVWIMLFMYTVMVPCLITSDVVSAGSSTNQTDGTTISTRTGNVTSTSICNITGNGTTDLNCNPTESVTTATIFNTTGNITTNANCTDCHATATSSPNNALNETNTIMTTVLENSTRPTDKPINVVCTTSEGKNNDKNNYNTVMMVAMVIVVVLAACWSVFVWFWHKRKNVQPPKDCIQLENGNIRTSVKRPDTNPYSVANGEDNISDMVESCYDNPNNNAEENDKDESDKESVNTDYDDAEGLQIRATTYSDPDYDVLDAEESDESGILDDDYTRAIFKNENKKDDPYDTTQSCQRMIYRRKNNETNIPEKPNHVIGKGKNGEKYEKCKEKRRSSENCFTDLNVCLTEDGENSLEDIGKVMENGDKHEGPNEKKRISKESCSKDLNVLLTKGGNNDLEEIGMKNGEIDDKCNEKKGKYGEILPQN